MYDILKDYPEIEEIHPLFGEYDIIAKIAARDVDALGKFVVEKIDYRVWP